MTPVHGSTLHALVASSGFGALVEPGAGFAALGVHQAECSSGVLLAGKVCYAAVAATRKEVPTGNDVGLRIDGGDILVFSHGQRDFAAGLSVAPVVEGHQTFVAAGCQGDGSAFLVHLLAIYHGRGG